jgi:hypothetical protein
MDMNEPQATANLSRDRRAPIFHTSKGYAAIIGASALDAAVVREVHWLAKEAGLPLTIYMIGNKTLAECLADASRGSD